MLVLIGAFGSGSNDDPTTANSAEQSQQENSDNNKDEEVVVEEKSPEERMKEDILGLISSGKAYDAGSYVSGDIPQGEYVFMPFSGGGKYYSEEDGAGNIIDNENFDSFGYVYVHGAGNISTRGVLIPLASLESLGVSGAKDVYEKMNGMTAYSQSAMYRIGMDLNPGQYIIQSQGSAYVAVLTGPVGNNDIVDNENFNGRHSVSVQSGQYLSISRGEITQ